MKNTTEHTGKLEIIQRLPSSVNGNPRYLVRVDGLTCRTSPDAMLAYGITNDDNTIVTASIGMHYGHTTIHNYKRA